MLNAPRKTHDDMAIAIAITFARPVAKPVAASMKAVAVECVVIAFDAITAAKAAAIVNAGAVSKAISELMS
jgi:hypothetical protein